MIRTYVLEGAIASGAPSKYVETRPAQTTYRYPLAAIPGTAIFGALLVQRLSPRDLRDPVKLVDNSDLVREAERVGRDVTIYSVAPAAEGEGQVYALVEREKQSCVAVQLSVFRVVELPSCTPLTRLTRSAGIYVSRYANRAVGHGLLYSIVAQIGRFATAVVGAQLPRSFVIGAKKAVGWGRVRLVVENEVVRVPRSRRFLLMGYAPISAVARAGLDIVRARLIHWKTYLLITNRFYTVGATATEPWLAPGSQLDAGQEQRLEDVIRAVKEVVNGLGVWIGRRPVSNWEESIVKAKVAATAPALVPDPRGHG